MRKRTSFVFVFLMMIFGCRAVSVRERIAIEERREQEIISKLELAEDYYAKGVMNNLKRNFKEARAAFDSALTILSEMEILTSEDDKRYQGRISTLLREIAYDYRIALLGNSDIDTDNAPAILAYALEESLNEKQIKELAAKLKNIPEKVTYDIPFVWNDDVKEKIVYIQTEIRKPFERWLTNSTRYVPIFKEILRRNGLPLDLAYLPLIESGYDPRAYSWAHAVGIWQFIASTAKIFGLKVNWWVDERRDPIRSTEAACRYLKKLYRQFGNWELALAAYNCGELRVEREIKQSGSNSFWNLNLPRQTRNYVPLFMAALAIAKNPEVFGFSVEKLPPFEYDSVEVEGGTDLRVVAKCADTTFDAIRELNPQFLRWSLPPGKDKYLVRLPKGKLDIFVERFKLVPEEKRKAQFVEHKVAKGETIESIAARYRVSPDAIITANKITNPRALRVGSHLLIPVKEERFVQHREEQVQNRPNIYIVKEGDTITKIAKNYGVSVDDILKMNNLSKNSVIRPGDTLILSEKAISAGRSGNAKGISRQEHIVQKGESLYSIARKYGVSVDDIVNWNNLPSNNVLLRIGQKLVIYKESANGGDTEKEKVVYTVKKGDNLIKIAKMFDVSVEDIKRWNKLSGHLIRENDRIIIYKRRSVEQRKKVYVVKPGDTVWSIASNFGVSVESIIKANGLLDPNRIKVGDELAIYINE